MNILYATSEARPFAASGGLADVAGSLPAALKRKGVDCRIIMPLYGSIRDDYQNKLKFVARIKVALAWRNQRCNIFKAKHNKVVYYFIEKDSYYERGRLYGEYDDGERFAFFSLAVLEMLPQLSEEFKPDIIHCNDWQTALIPIFLSVRHAKDAFYENIKTVFTIHNIAFQGDYDFGAFKYVFGLPDEAGGIVDFAGRINLLKGAIETSYAITTVSPTYSNEIAGICGGMTGYDFGWGLTWFIKDRAWKLTGILNGLDSELNPKTDVNLYKNYEIANYKEGKAANKLELQKRLGLAQRDDIPLVAIITRIDSQQKGCQLLRDAVYGGILYRNDFQLVILGSAADGDREGKEMEWIFRWQENQNRGKMVSYIGFVPELAYKIYAAADIYLVPSLYEPCGLSQMIALKYGAIPVVRETGGLADTVTDNTDGNGNGFTFMYYDRNGLEYGINNALNCYKDEKQWDALVRRAMACDFSWDTNSADEYIKLYEGLVNGASN